MVFSTSTYCTWLNLSVLCFEAFPLGNSIWWYPFLLAPIQLVFQQSWVESKMQRHQTEDHWLVKEWRHWWVLKATPSNTPLFKTRKQRQCFTNLQNGRIFSLPGYNDSTHIEVVLNCRKKNKTNKKIEEEQTGQVRSMCTVQLDVQSHSLINLIRWFSSIVHAQQGFYFKTSIKFVVLFWMSLLHK